jgi:Transposase DDE domain.
LVGGNGFAVDASLIQADANKQRSVPGSQWDPQSRSSEARRAVRDYIATLDDEAFGAATEVVPKFVSPSDPAAQWTGALRGPAFFAYATNYLIDTRHAIIVDVEATRAIRQAEVGAARTMLDRTAERFGLRPRSLAGDSAYGSAAMLGWLVEQRGIAPHIPVLDKSSRKDGTLSRADFHWEAKNDRYVCPHGRFLKTTGQPTADGTLLYRSKNVECAVCPLKTKCCPHTPFRKITRDLHEDARDVARSLAGTDAFEQSRHDRKRVEMLFAHLKRILRLGRLRLRGPSGAKDEFLLAATAQNLRRLAKLTIETTIGAIPATP